jgi:hypothetical protein
MWYVYRCAVAHTRQQNIFFYIFFLSSILLEFFPMRNRGVLVPRGIYLGAFSLS